ncbi:MAG: DUF664 domain-containing protein [Chloroflexi bacterium]|nr:DUF664 domain-containing protein [Chloroflexota bacterium]
MLPAVELYEQLMRDRRANVLKILDGLDADALNWHPLSDATNSLYALAVHALGAERHWIHERTGGRKIERDRAAEFRAKGDDVAVLRAQYENVAQVSKEILERLTEAEVDVLRDDGKKDKFTFRFCILHIIDHYAEHVGQMALTRQLWENRAERPNEI